MLINGFIYFIDGLAILGFSSMAFIAGCVIGNIIVEKFFISQ